MFREKIEFGLGYQQYIKYCINLSFFFLDKFKKLYLIHIKDSILREDKNMRNNLIKKCFIIWIILLFFWISIYQNCAISYPSDISIDLGFRDVIWNVTLSFDEPDGANDYTIFGEASDANDGSPPDNYDEPKPPAPPTPYIRASFNDSLNEPYNFLWKDYRHYPDTSKKWNLSVQWVPIDFVTPTTVTISWSTDEVGFSEYSIVKFCNSSEVQLRNMLIENNYSFLCPAMVPQIFYIICQGNNTPPEKPEKPSGQTQGNINVEYTYSSKTIDAEGNQIYYWFDWGDGNNSGWVDLTAENVTLDCDGYKIEGLGEGIGIFLDYADNFIMKNCKI